MDSTQLAKQHALSVTGLNWDRKDKWTDAQRRAYLDANAAFRKTNPQLFTADQLAAADNYASAAAQEEIEFSWWGTFWNELGGSTRSTLGSLWKNTFGTIPVWLRWLVGLGLAAYLLTLLRPYLPPPARTAAPTRKRQK